MLSLTGSVSSQKRRAKCFHSTTCGLQAKKHVQLVHPRLETIVTTKQGVQTVYTKHSFCDTHIGSHPLLCCGDDATQDGQQDIADMLEHHEDDLKSGFSKYGTGVVLMFKFIGYMFSVFLLLTIISIPSIYIFVESDALSNEIVTTTQQVASFSLGNLGEGHTECNAVESSDAGASEELLHVGCPAGASIGSVNAIFGDIQGVCGCPIQQTPKTACPNDFPYLAGEREVGMPNGATFKSTPCCASQRDSTGRPLFPDLDFVYSNMSLLTGEPACASSNAQTIASKRCLGRQSCELSPSPTALQSWTVDYASSCDTEAGFKLSRSAAGELVCSASMKGRDDFAACPSNKPLRLVVVARCFADQVNVGFFGNISKQDIAVMIAIFDAAGILCFVLLVRNLVKREKKEAEFRGSTSVADYTVFLPSLPEHDNIQDMESDLRDFLEWHLNATPEVPMYNSDGTDIEPTGPVKIVDINFGLADTRLITLNKRRGELLYKLETAEKTHLVLTQGEETYKKLRAWAADGHFEVGCCPWVRRHPYLHAKMAFDEMQRLIAKINEVDEEIDVVLHGGTVSSPRSPKLDRVEATHARCAYVTFETAEAALRARREFPNSRFMGWCTRQYVKRNGGDDLLQAALTDKHPIPIMPEKYDLYPLRTRSAPEPSDIVWENVGVPRATRWAKQTITSVLTLGLLFGIFILVFYLEDTKRGIQLEHPKVECSQFADPDNVQAAVFDEMLVLSDSYAALNPNSTRTGRMECFCQELLSNNSGNPLALESFFFTVPYPEGPRKQALCWDWFQSFVAAQAITYGVALLTLLLNSLAKPLIEWMVSRESRRSRGSQLYSAATKLFGFQVVNTGLVVLLVNSYFDSPWFVFGQGAYRDFGTDWYLGPGTSISVTMFLIIFTPQIARLGRGLMKWISICRDRNCSFDKHITQKITQFEFNRQFEGQDMDVAERYAQMLTVAFVSLAYSSLLPILIPMAALFFGLMMVAEKLFFIHCYRTPPAFAPALPKAMASLLMYAVPPHLAFGLWAMTNPDIFPSSDALQSAMDASLAANSSTASLSFQNAAQKGLSEVAALDSGSLEFSSRFESTAGIVLFICFLLIGSCLVFQAVLFRWIRQILVVIGRCCSQKRKLRKNLPPLWQTLPIADINSTITAGRDALDLRQKGHLWGFYEKAYSFNQRHQQASDVIDSAMKRIQALEREAYEVRSDQESLENQITQIESFRVRCEERWRRLRLEPNSDERQSKIDDVMDELENYDSQLASLHKKVSEHGHQLDEMADLYDELNAAIQTAKQAAATKTKVERGVDRIEGLASYSMQSHPDYASVFGLSVNIFDATLAAQLKRNSSAETHAKAQVKLARQASARMDLHSGQLLKHLRSFSPGEMREAIIPEEEEEQSEESGLPLQLEQSQPEPADIQGVEMVELDGPREPSPESNGLIPSESKQAAEESEQMDVGEAKPEPLPEDSSLAESSTGNENEAEHLDSMPDMLQAHEASVMTDNGESDSKNTPSSDECLNEDSAEHCVQPEAGGGESKHS